MYLVVEEDAVGGVHVVGFAVVHHDPVGVLLGHPVRRARIEGRLLRLRNLSHLAIQLLRGERLVEARSEVGEAARAERIIHMRCPIPKPTYLQDGGCAIIAKFKRHRWHSYFTANHHHNDKR